MVHIIKKKMLFKRILLAKYLQDTAALLYSITWKYKGNYHTIAFGWSITSEWWYNEDPKDARFIDFRKKITEQYTHYGFYLMRLALGYSYGGKNK